MRSLRRASPFILSLSKGDIWRRAICMSCILWFLSNKNDSTVRPGGERGEGKRGAGPVEPALGATPCLPSTWQPFPLRTETRLLIGIDGELTDMSHARSPH